MRIITDKISYELANLYYLHGEIQLSLNILATINNESPYAESALLFEAEIYDYIINNKSKAVDTYLFYLDKFPDSMHYDLVRTRLRKLAS